MNEHTANVVIKPVSNWPAIAARMKREGCPNVGTFVLYWALHCIHVPPTAMKAIYEVFGRTDE